MDSDDARRARVPHHERCPNEIAGIAGGRNGERCAVGTPQNNTEPIATKRIGVDTPHKTEISATCRRDRIILLISDDKHAAKQVGDAFEANSYEVLATDEMPEAVRFATTRNPGIILLMCSSLAVTCNIARQIRPHTSARIIGFSTMPITTAERNAAVQSGCDDYRDAFLQHAG